MEARFIQNDKGKWRWIIPREGPDVTPLNRFDSKEAATLDFLKLQRRLATPWVEQRDNIEKRMVAAHHRLAKGLDAHERLRRWLLVSGNRPALPGALHRHVATVNQPPSASE